MTLPSVGDFLASRRKKQQTEYDKAMEDGETPLSSPPSQPEITSIPSVGDFLAKRYTQPETPRVGMGDLRVVTGEGENNPPLPAEVEPVEVPDATAGPAYSPKNENKIYDFPFEENKPIGYQGITTQQAVEQSIVKDQQKQVEAQVRSALEREKQLKGYETNPMSLARAIRYGQVLPKEMERFNAGQIPWDVLRQIGTNEMAAISDMAKSNPEGARNVLIDWMKNRETTGYDVMRAIRNAGTDIVTFGAQKMEVPPQTPAGGAAYFATQVAGQIPLTLAAGSTVAGVKNPLVKGALIGAELAGAREIAGGLARPDEFDLGDSLKRVATNATEYAAYMGVYSKLSPAVDAMVAKSPVLEKALSTLPGEVLKGGAVGSVAGAGVGTGKAVLDALSGNGFDVRAMVKRIGEESGQEMKEEVVEAIALGIAQGIAKRFGANVNVPPVNAQTQQQQAPAQTQTTTQTRPEPAFSEQDQRLIDNAPFAVPVKQDSNTTGKIEDGPLAVPTKNDNAMVKQDSKLPYEPSTYNAPRNVPVDANVAMPKNAGLNAVTPKPIDRVALLREKMPGADEAKLRSDVETTKNLTDGEFIAFAERYGKADTSATTATVQPSQNTSTLTAETRKAPSVEETVEREGFTGPPVVMPKQAEPKLAIPNGDIKVGDSVKISNRTAVYEVVDTKDTATLTVREVGKPNAPELKVGRKAVTKNENAVYDSAPTEVPTTQPQTQQTKTPVVTPSKPIGTPAVNAKSVKSNDTSLESSTIQEYNTPVQSNQGVASTTEQQKPKSEESPKTQKRNMRMNTEWDMPNVDTRVFGDYTIKRSMESGYGTARQKFVVTYKGSEIVPKKPVTTMNGAVEAAVEHAKKNKIPTELEPSEGGGSSSLQNVKQVYDSAPEGYTVLRKNGNTAFTEKFANAEAERLKSQGQDAVVIPDKAQPNLRNVYVAPKKGLLSDETGAIRAPQDPTYTEDPIAQELDKSISWNTRKTPLIDKVKAIPEYINNTVHYLVDNLFDSNVAVTRYQTRNAGKKELPTNQDAALKLELLPKMVPGNVRAALGELETILSPLGEKVADYFRYADARVNLWRMERFGYEWNDGNGDLPMNPDVAKAWVDKVNSGPDARLFQDTFAREQQLFQTEGLRTLVDAGVISQEEMDKAIEDHPEYVPWYRDMTADENAAGVAQETKEDRQPNKLGRTVVNVPNPIKKQTGSGRKLLDPMERRIRYLSRAQSVALRNKVGIALTNFAKEYDKQGTGMVKVAPPMMAVTAKLQVKDKKTGVMRDTDVMHQLEDLGFDPNDLADPNASLKFFKPAGMPKGYEQVVAIRENGKVTYWKVKDKGLYDAITHMDPITQNMFAKFFESSALLYRTGATITPSFSIANIIKDTIDSFRLSKNQVYPGQALWKAIRMSMDKDPIINRVIRDGLKQNGWVSPERLTNDMLMSIANPQEKTMSLKAAWNLYLNTRDTAEFATRLGETGLDYRRRLTAGMKDLSPDAKKVVQDFLDGKTKEIPQDAIDKYDDLRDLELNSYLRALREGGRITLNFTRDGKTTRAVNRFVPFFSIPFKAAYREYEAATEHPMTYAIKTVLPAVSLGMALVLLNKDDEKYFEASDFERDKYMLIPMGEGFIRIPKGNGIGGFVLNMTERAMRQWMLEDETAFRDWADTARNDLFPRITNPALELLVAGSTGYSMNMERQIIPERLKKLTETAPELQFDSRTSPTVKNVVAPALGKLPVVGKYLKSPMLTQYVVNAVIPGYSEGYFMTENYVKRGTNAVKSGTPPVDIAKSVSFEELPAVGRFYSRPGDGKMGRSVDLLYEEQSKAEGAYQEVRARLADESNQPVRMDALTRAQRSLLPEVIDKLSPEEKTYYERKRDYDKAVDKLSKLNSELRALESDEGMNPATKRQRIEEIRREMTRLAGNVLSEIRRK